MRAYTMSVSQYDEQYLEVGDAEDKAESRAGDETSEEESDSEDDGEVEERQAKVSVKECFEMTLKDIQDGKLDLTSDSQFQSFKSGDGNLLASLTGDVRAPTVLHIMATMEKKDLPKLDSKMEPLIKYLTLHKNDLLKVQDRSGHNPMYLAIESKKERMVEWMSDVHPRIADVLSISSMDQKNSIHVGIEKRVKFLDNLIDKADIETLVAKDRDGNTPLHSLVEYKRCKKEQLAIIERIVAKSDRALQKKTSGDFNNAGRSPFLHHKESVRRARDKEAEKEGKKSRDDKDRDIKGSVSRPRPDALETDNPKRPSSSPRLSAITPSTIPGNVRPDKSRNLHLETLTKYGGRGPASVTPNTPAALGAPPPLSLEPPSTNDAKKLSQQPETSPSKATDAKNLAEKHKSKVDEATVKDVERFLKLHYLRSRSYNAAMEILYGRNMISDLELYFDLSGHTNINQTGLENLMSKLKFEDVLQYVAIPKLNVETSTNVANSKRSRVGTRVKQDGDGRRDLCFIFDRLRKMGVKTILKIIVDDLSMPAHSDEAIEEALNDMDVEIWDWKRTDLCSEVIQRVAPKVREVHLYWSGNNAVLRGWSEEGGLKRLGELEKVQLHVQQGLETSSRTKQNVEEFCERMKKLCPEVNISKEGPIANKGPADVGVLAANDQAEHSTKHEWIQCMKDFRRLVFNAELYYEGQKVDGAIKIEEPIKVALIDDGVDVKDLEYPFIGGRTFCTRDEEHNLNAPYYISSAGHGTIMAKQIYLMCPRAQIYVLRLEDHAFEGSRQLTARSAAQAIMAAVRKKVHIISMSWTIDPPENEDERRLLDLAITEAASKDVLLFCSASDKGAKTGLTYPAKATTKIFTIGAARSSGMIDEWVSNLNVHFTFPGVKVELEASRTDAGNPHALKEATGSSVATALAAGLAALVLYCVQIRVLLASEPDKSKARKDFQNLKKHENMLKAFKDIGTTEESQHKFIEVWDVFGKKLEEKDHYDKDRWIDLIGDVGATLCRKM